MDALHEFEAFEQQERGYAAGVADGRGLSRWWFVNLDHEPHAGILFGSENHALLDKVQGMLGGTRDGDVLVWLGKDILTFEIFKNDSRQQAVRRCYELLVSVVNATTREERARAASALQPYAYESTDGLLMGWWK
jgi:hypothetical protein